MTVVSSETWLADFLVSFTSSCGRLAFLFLSFTSSSVLGFPLSSECFLCKLDSMLVSITHLSSSFVVSSKMLFSGDKPSISNSPRPSNAFRDPFWSSIFRIRTSFTVSIALKRYLSSSSSSFPSSSANPLGFSKIVSYATWFACCSLS